LKTATTTKIKRQKSALTANSCQTKGRTRQDDELGNKKQVQREAPAEVGSQHYRSTSIILYVNCFSSTHDEAKE